MTMTKALRERIDFIEHAIDEREVLSFEYQDEKGKTTSRAVEPLGLWFWGKVWTLVACAR